MTKLCDNKSVGIMIEDERGRQAIIFRKNYPQAYSPIAGHVDGLTPREAALKEAVEEGGLTLSRFVLVMEERIENPCKRDGGIYHDWTIFDVYEWLGEFHASSDAKEAVWFEPAAMQRIAKRTEYFMGKFGIPHADVSRLTRAIFGDPQKPQTDAEWEKEPGLEPVWYYIFKKLGKI